MSVKVPTKELKANQEIRSFFTTRYVVPFASNPDAIGLKSKGRAIVLHDAFRARICGSVKTVVPLLHMKHGIVLYCSSPRTRTWRVIDG